MENLIDFLNIARRLKSTPRAGWVETGIPKVESVADHSWYMALLALLLSPPANCNKDKCIRLAVVHDLAEAITGDITPTSDISKEKKHEMERDAIAEMARLLPEEMSRELIALHDEYDKNTTPESSYVHELDKVDMMLQAAEYENDCNVKLDSFFSSRPHSPELQRIITHVLSTRKMMTDIEKTPNKQFS